MNPYVEHDVYIELNRLYRHTYAYLSSNFSVEHLMSYCMNIV